MLKFFKRFFKPKERCLDKFPIEGAGGWNVYCTLPKNHKMPHVSESDCLSWEKELSPFKNL